MTIFEVFNRVNYGGHHSICSRLTSCRQSESQEISESKSQQDLVSTMMNVFNKFDINPLGCLNGNVWIPWKCDGWTYRWMNIRMNGWTSPFLSQWRIWHQVHLSSPGQIMFPYQSPSNCCSEKCWSVRGTDMMTSCVKLLNCMSLKMWPEQKGVIFLTSSNAFCF